jgi:autotransporter-associated beta strand protein
MSMGRFLFAALFGAASAAARGARRARRRAVVRGKRPPLAVEEFESRIVPTSYRWKDTNDGNWATSTNWTPAGVPGINDSVTFPSTVASAQTVTLPPSVTTSVSAIVFAQVGSVEIAAGAGSTLATSSVSFNGFASTTASAIISAPLSLFATTLSANLSNQSIVVSGPVSGSLPFVKTGAGTLVLSGVNSYTGGTTVTGGTLSISSDANLGSTTTANPLILNGAGAVLNVTSSVTLNANHKISISTSGAIINGVSGGGLTLTASGAISNSGTLTITGSAADDSVLVVDAPQVGLGSVQVNSGRIAVSDSTATLGFGNVTIAGAGAVWVNAAAAPVLGNVFFVSTAGGEGRGAIRISTSGTRLGKVSVLGNATVGYDGPSGGSVTFTSGLVETSITPQLLSLGGFAGSTSATWVVPETINPMITANILVNATPALQTLNLVSTFSSSLFSAISGAGNLIKSGTGTQVVYGFSSYTGPLTFSGGTLQLIGDNLLPTASSLVLAGAANSTLTLNLGTNSQTLGSIFIPSTLTSSGTLTTNANGGGFGSGTLAVKGSSDLQLGPPSTTAASTATVFDFSTLNKFTYAPPAPIVNTFRVGFQAPTGAAGTAGNSNSGSSTVASTVSLPPTDTIAAKLLAVGDMGGATGGGLSTLNLGWQADTLNVSTINVGASGQSSALLDFMPHTGATPITIRNTDGVSPVDEWDVGLVDGNRPGTTWTAAVDLSGAATDAHINKLVIGSAATADTQVDNQGGTENASFLLGSTNFRAFTASSVVIGSIRGASAASNPLSANGTFTIGQNGTLIAHDITLADNTIASTTPGILNSVSGTLNLQSGTLMATIIAKGAQTGLATASASLVWTNGSIENNGANTTISGVPITLLSGFLPHDFIVDPGLSMTLDAGSPISGVGLVIEKDKTGTLILNAASTYTGSTVIDAGALQAGNDAAFGAPDSNASLGVANLATVHANGFDVDVGSLVGAGKLDNGAATAASFTVHEGAASSFFGTIVDGGAGALSLVKDGSATLTLTGANTYSGTTTIDAGTLLVDNTSGLGTGTGTVTVAAGATLGGKGSVGNVIAQGDIRPGDGPPGTLITGALSLGSGTLFLDLASATSFDSVVDSADGTSVQLDGTTLNLNIGTIETRDAFKIVSVPGTLASALVGTFTNLPTSGSTMTVGGRQFQINYAGGDGNDIVLTDVTPTLLVGGSPALNGGSPYINSPLAANQHSMVESIVYSFSQAVTLNASNFTLSGLPGTTVVPSVNVASSSAGTVWTVTFAGAGVNNGTHSIGDGEYQLVLNGVPGMAANTYDFFRLLGDMDGNGTVNTSDFSTLVSTFLRSPSDPLYLGADDFDGDNTIGTTDFAQFTSNFLKSLPTPLPN